jgi:hypothetical protein
MRTVHLKRRGYVLFALILCCFFCTSCKGEDLDEKSAEVEKSTETLKLKTAESPSPNRSIVRIRTIRGSGSGFVIQHQKDLYIATAAHVVSSNSTAKIEIIYGNESSVQEHEWIALEGVEVALLDFESDIALLRLARNPGNMLHPLKLSQKNCGAGERTLGFPSTALTDSGEQGLTMTKLVGVKEAALDAHDEIFGGLRRFKKGTVDGLIFRPALAPGHSGGPVVDSDDSVTGIVTTRSGTEGKSTATCISHLKPMLAALTPKPPNLTKVAARELITSLRDKFLENAQDVDWRETPLDYILPSSLGQFRRLVEMFMDYRASLLGFPGGEAGEKTQDISRLKSYIDRSWAEAFPGIVDWTSKNLRKCDAFNYTQCHVAKLVYPLAVRRITKQLEWLSKKNATYEIVGEPQLVSQQPRIFEVVFSGGSKEAARETHTVQFTWEAGRFWFTPTDAKSSFVALLKNANARFKEREALLDRYVGTYSAWIPEVRQKEKFSDGCGHQWFKVEHKSVRFEIRRSKRHDLEATLVRRLKVRRSTLRSSCWGGIVFECNGRRRSRVEGSVTTRFVGDLDLDMETGIVTFTKRRNLPEYGSDKDLRRADVTEPPNCHNAPGFVGGMRQFVSLTEDGNLKSMNRAGYFSFSATFKDTKPEDGYTSKVLRRISAN